MDIIDLKWDPLALDIVLDDYELEPLTVENLAAIHQSFSISIRGSNHAQQLINCDPEEVPGLLIDLGEEIENLHQSIVVLGSIDLKYDFATQRLLFDCMIEDPPADPIPVHILLRLGNE